MVEGGFAEPPSLNRQILSETEIFRLKRIFRHSKDVLRSLEYLEIILRHRFSSLTKKNLRGGFNDPPPSTISGQCIDFHQNIASFWPGSAIF